MNSYVLVVCKCFGGFDRFQDVRLIPSVSIGTASILEREEMMGGRELLLLHFFFWNIAGP